jgi:hypothetical protein
VPERETLATLSNSDRERWLRAVGFYRETIAARSHWDLELLRVKRDLLSLGGDPAASPPDRIKGIRAALATAMPVYRRKWWPEHDRANRRWIGVVAPRLRAHEARFVQTMLRLNRGTTWPEDRWRVDVSAYANGRAGYTTREGHVVIYSTDSAVQNLYGLEMVFHEIQHASAVAGASEEDLARAFETAGAKMPPNLSHALMFATAGAFTQSVAERDGLPPHTPYWIKQGFEDRDDWKNLFGPVNEHWVPVVRGNRSKEEGLTALAHAFKGR